MSRPSTALGVATLRPPARYRARRALRARRTWSQLASYCAVGLSGFAVNLAVYSTLVGQAGLPYGAAAVGSFLVAVTNNFTWNRVVTFRRRRGELTCQGMRFLIVSTVGLIGNLLALHVLIRLGAGEVAAQAASIVLVTPVSFLGNKLWSFRSQTGASAAGLAVGPWIHPAPRGRPWLVLPTYNEVENLAGIVAAARSALRRAAPEGFEILIVDDDSPDGTGRLADRLSAADPAVHVLHRTRREGLGPAYIAGFTYALERGAGWVLQMDADGSHDPGDLARLLAAARDGGADLAVGSRYAAGGAIAEWSLLRRAISRGGCWYARTVLGVAVRDLTGGFKCYRADVLESVDLQTVRSRGYAFQVELTYRALRAGFRVAEVPITFGERVRGRSKMTWGIALEAAWLVPQLPRGARNAALAPPRRTPAVAVPEAA